MRKGSKKQGPYYHTFPHDDSTNAIYIYREKGPEESLPVSLRKGSKKKITMHPGTQLWQHCTPYLVNIFLHAASVDVSNVQITLVSTSMSALAVATPTATLCMTLRPKSVDHPLMQGSLNVSSPGRMSPRSVEPISPMSARLSALALREKQQQQQLHLRSLSSREFGAKQTSSLVGSPVHSWANWGSPTGKVDWSVNGGGEEAGRLRRSSSFELGNNGEEPDLSWVQSLVKESPPEMREKQAAPVSGAVASSEGFATKASLDSVDHSVIGTWLEQMQLDQLVAQ